MKRRDVFKSFVTGIATVVLTQQGVGNTTVLAEPGSSNTIIGDQPIIPGYAVKIDEMHLTYKGKEIIAENFSEINMLSGDSITVTFHCDLRSGQTQDFTSVMEH